MTLTIPQIIRPMPARCKMIYIACINSSSLIVITVMYKKTQGMARRMPIVMDITNLSISNSVSS